MSGPTLGDYARMARRGSLFRAWSYFWETHVYDLLRRTDTAHWRPKSSPNLPNGEHGYGYEPSYTCEIRRCLAIVARQALLEAYDFYDLGCGKGKALLVAGRMGVRGVTGVEYDPELVEIARRNLRILGLGGRVVEADAARFAEYEPRSIVYFFNPFDEDLLRIVLKTLERMTTECIAIYTNPTHPAAFSGWRTVATTSGRHSSLVSHIYQYEAQRSPHGSDLRPTPR